MLTGDTSKMKHNTAKNILFIDLEPEEIKILGYRESKDLALKTLDLLINNCFRDGVGFYHTYFKRNAGITGFLDDQVKMAIACLDAFEVTGSSFYFKMAVDSGDLIVERFYDERKGVFFDTEESRENVVTLKSRFKPIQDDPIPSPAERTLRYFGGVAEKYRLYAATYFLAVHNHIKYPLRVVVVGEKESSTVQVLLETAWRVYRPHKIVIQIDPSDAGVVPLLSQTIGEMAKIKSPAAFVCSGTSCAEPTDNPKILRETIKAFRVK